MGLTPKLPELLCPAGSPRHLQTALIYGADAVYLGGSQLNLRSKARGFSRNELQQAISLAAGYKARVYYCLNALPLQRDIPLIQEQLDMVSGLDLSGLIVADPGVLDLARKNAPGLDLHLSTQANTCSLNSVNFWKDQGVKRVNLSRELELSDIRAISRQVQGVELELFVHGAMCMAISGRCFLSAHLNRRSANQGLCAHPCRYEYRPFITDLQEKTRPEYPLWTLEQGDSYSAIFSAQDLCLVKFIPWFVRNGIHALKIEGRTKSVAYLGIVTDIYRTAIDDFARKKFRPKQYLEELTHAGTRLMGTGLFLKNRITYPGPGRKACPRKKILALILERKDENKWLIQVKEKWPESVDVELVLPGMKRPLIPAEHYCLEGETGQKISTAHPGTNAIFCCQQENVQEGIFIRGIIS